MPVIPVTFNSSLKTQGPRIKRATFFGRFAGKQNQTSFYPFCSNDFFSLEPSTPRLFLTDVPPAKPHLTMFFPRSPGGLGLSWEARPPPPGISKKVEGDLLRRGPPLIPTPKSFQKVGLEPLNRALFPLIPPAPLAVFPDRTGQGEFESFRAHIDERHLAPRESYSVYPPFWEIFPSLEFETGQKYIAPAPRGPSQCFFLIKQSVSPFVRPVLSRLFDAKAQKGARPSPRGSPLPPRAAGSPQPTGSPGTPAPPEQPFPVTDPFSTSPLTLFLWARGCYRSPDPRVARREVWPPDFRAGRPGKPRRAGLPPFGPTPG